MSTLTDNDLRELKDLIKSLDNKFNDMRVDIATIKTEVNSINQRLNENIQTLNKKLDENKETLNKKLDENKETLNKKLDENKETLNKKLDENKETLNQRLDDNKEALNKRLDNLDFIARTLIGGIILALLGALAKMLYPNLFS